MTRFVMFKTPFEGVLDAVIFEEVEEANERYSTPEHRIFPISQGTFWKQAAMIPLPERKVYRRQVGREVSPRPAYLLDDSGERAG